VYRCIKEEFRGTAYSPLPDIGALTRVIDDVNRSMVTEGPRIQSPEMSGTFVSADELRKGFAAMWTRIESKVNDNY
jgi:hypothetical protein